MTATEYSPPDLHLVDKEEQPTERVHKVDDDIIALDMAKEMKYTHAHFHNYWKRLEKGCWNTLDEAEMRVDIRKKLRYWRASREVPVSQQRIRAITAMLEDDLHISDRAIMDTQAEQKRYINLRNGLFNLETLELEPHRPELYFTNQLDFDYTPDVFPDVWNKYLNSSLVHPDGTTDHSLITLVKEALGYSLTARTDMKASFWLVGERDSGKSTMISFLKLFMGALHGTIDLTQLGTNRFLLSNMVGKRVVTFTEAETNTVLPDALYKALVGGSDDIYADVKNKQPITFIPECKIWWAMNGMPRITDRSGATTRRIYIIPFNLSIPVESRIPNLEALLYKERASIFNDLINHYQRVIRRPGFSPCAQSEARRTEYIAENDTEATYLADRCDRHESYRVQSSELYQDYSYWCESFGFKPRNINQIAGEWRRLGLIRQKSDGISMWQGVRIRKLLK